MARLISRKQSMRLRRRGRRHAVRHGTVSNQEPISQAPTFLGPYLVTRATPILEEDPERLHTGVGIDGELNASTNRGPQMEMSESNRERGQRKRKERRKRGIRSCKTNDAKDSNVVEFAKGAENDNLASNDNDLENDDGFLVDNDPEDDAYEDYDSANDVDYIFENIGEYDESDEIETNYEDEGPEEDDEDFESGNSEIDREDDEDEYEDEDEVEDENDDDAEDGTDCEAKYHSNDQDSADDDGMVYDDASGELVPRPTRYGKWFKKYLRKQRREEKRYEEYNEASPF